jgi:dCMP deaminase
MVTFADVLRDEDRRDEIQRKLKWDMRWMEIAEAFAGWSKDPAQKVGAVLVYGRNNTIVSSGYNGFPRALADERLHDRPFKLSRTVHAEVNCLFNAIATAHHMHGLTMYVYGLPPCTECSKNIIQSGMIKRVVTNRSVAKVDGSWETSCFDGYTMLIEANIQVESLQ